MNYVLLANRVLDSDMGHDDSHLSCYFVPQDSGLSKN